MRTKFDYKKAKYEAERMLEVIEREPPKTTPTWAESVQALVPVFYSIAITGIVMSSIASVFDTDNKA